MIAQSYALFCGNPNALGLFRKILAILVLERVTYAHVGDDEGLMADAVFTTRVEGGVNACAKHESTRTLVAIAYSAIEKIAERTSFDFKRHGDVGVVEFGFSLNIISSETDA